MNIKEHYYFECWYTKKHSGNKDILLDFKQENGIYVLPEILLSYNEWKVKKKELETPKFYSTTWLDINGEIRPIQWIE